ncbi:MFS transporter [Actinomadura sp. KC216]|uniref:MFS transporter n=1 Tax=Actinomadura sp. KC216 TaxID=2530370 RepID=UPI00104FB937|nr:MFS transporter [Actinomadura sp. KC216]TDB90165.1 MFS transporter [Actinomadura sp. KC216]
MVFFLIGISQSSLGPLLSLYNDRFDVGTPRSSLLITGYFAGALLAMLTASLVRLSGRWLFPCALTLYAAGNAGLFLSPWLGPAAASATMAGLSAGGLILYTNTAFARQDGGVALINLLNGMFASGTIVGPLVAGWSIGTGRPYGLLAVTIGTVFCHRVSRLRHWPAEDGPPRSDASPGASDHTSSGASSGVAIARSIAPFLLLYLCYGVLETGIGGWAATHLESQDFSAANAARILAAFWAGTAIAKFAVPIYAARTPEGKIILIGLAGTTAALALATVPHASVVAYALTGLALGPVFPTGLAWLVRLGGGQRAVGMASASSMAGSVLVPVLITWPVTHAPATIPLFFSAAGVFAMAAASWAWRSARSGGGVGAFTLEQRSDESEEHQH